MDKLEIVGRKEPHEVCELICLKCLNRWIGVFPQKVLLKELQCKCGEIGYVIKTGQTIRDSDITEFELYQ